MDLFIYLFTPGGGGIVIYKVFVFCHLLFTNCVKGLFWLVVLRWWGHRVETKKKTINDRGEKADGKCLSVYKLEIIVHITDINWGLIEVFCIGFTKQIILSDPKIAKLIYSGSLPSKILEQHFSLALIEITLYFIKREHILSISFYLFHLRLS